ncbi:MAG: PEP-CTERM sorting domain-containing protein [Verrucomicrobiota bacterium]
MSFRAFVFPSLVLLASLSPAPAGVVDWDGGGVDNKWSTGDNWNTNVIPVTVAPLDDVRFAGSVRPGVDVDTQVSVQTLKFISGAAAFTLGGTGVINLAGTGTGHDSGLHLRNESSALQTINNNIVFTGTSIGFNAVSGNMTFNGGIDMTAATNIRFLGSGGRVTTFNGVISGTGAGQLAFNSGGTFVINNLNSYTKTTSIWTATVKLNVDAPNGANGAFGNSTGTVNLGTTFDGRLTSTLLTTNAVTVGRTLTLASPHANQAATPHIFTIGGETAHISNYTGTIFNANDQGTKAANKLTVTAAAGGRVNIANIVRGTGALGTADDVVKVGNGIVAITGSSNNWQGNTLVQAGTFLVNGSVLTSPSGKNVQVSSGAILGGNGTLTREVSLAAGAILSPGDVSAAGVSLGGKLTVGDLTGLTLAPTSVLRFDLGTFDSSTDDEVSVRGNLTLAGQLNVTDLGGFGNGAYKLFDWTGLLTYNPADLTFGNLPSGFTYTIDTTTWANSAYLVVTPEPGRALLLFVGLSTLLFNRRRKAVA